LALKKKPIKNLNKNSLNGMDITYAIVEVESKNLNTRLIRICISILLGWIILIYVHKLCLLIFGHIKIIHISDVLVYIQIRCVLERSTKIKSDYLATW
jgi:hypothetical protein